MLRNGTTPHSITAYTADSTLNATLLFSCLPLLEVKATLSKEYQPATFTLHHPDSLKPLQLKGRIKWRGKTTLSNDRHKRNFHIKLEDDNGDKLNLKLLGMRDDNSWLLDGGQTDLSRIRNLVAHQLWLDMAAKPYYADREPKARSAVRGELIELIVNGQYEGIYAQTAPDNRSSEGSSGRPTPIQVLLHSTAPKSIAIPTPYGSDSKPSILNSKRSHPLTTQYYTMLYILHKRPTTSSGNDRHTSTTIYLSFATTSSSSTHCLPSITRPRTSIGRCMTEHKTP